MEEPYPLQYFRDEATLSIMRPRSPAVRGVERDILTGGGQARLDTEKSSTLVFSVHEGRRRLAMEEEFSFGDCW